MQRLELELPDLDRLGIRWCVSAWSQGTVAGCYDPAWSEVTKLAVEPGSTDGLPREAVCSTDLCSIFRWCQQSSKCHF